MNGIGSPTVGQLLRHRRRATTAIYAYLDDAALQDAAARAAAVIADAMQYRPEVTPLRGEARDLKEVVAEVDKQFAEVRGEVTFAQNEGQLTC